MIQSECDQTHMGMPKVISNIKYEYAKNELSYDADFCMMGSHPIETANLFS